MSVYEWNTHPPKLFKSHCGLLIPRFVVCLIGHPPILLLSRSSEECAILSIFIPLIAMSIIIRKTSRASLLHVLSIASPPNILSLPQRRRRPPMLRNLSGFLWNLQIIRRIESPSACSWFKFKLWGFYLYRDITQPHTLQMDTHLLRDPTRRRESLLRLFVVVWVAAPHNFTRPTLTLTGVNPSLVVSCTCAFCIHQLHTPITFYHFTVSHSAPCPQQIIAFYSPIRPTTDLFSLACCDHNNTMFWHWMVVQDSSMAPQQDNVCVLVLLLWLPAKMSSSRVFYYSRDCDVVPVFCKWEINLNSPMGTLSRGLQADCLSVHRISRLSHRLCVMLSDSLVSGCRYRNRTVSW